MKNFYEELKKYFENSSQDKIMNDWSKSKDCDNVGPSVEEFIINLKHYHVSPETPLSNFSNNIDLKYTSGFFI
jgi:hypothetical protein